MTEDNNVYGVEEAAALKSVHPQTIKLWYYKYGLKGELKGHTLIFRHADLVAFKPPRGRSALTESGEDKHILAAKMHDNQGKTLAEIAETLGYAGESGASKAVKSGRAKLAKAKKKSK